jgi:hypothetical protein
MNVHETEDDRIDTEKIENKWSYLSFSRLMGNLTGLKFQLLQFGNFDRREIPIDASDVAEKFRLMGFSYKVKGDR